MVIGSAVENLAEKLDGVSWYGSPNTLCGSFARHPEIVLALPQPFQGPYHADNGWGVDQ